MDLLKDSGLTNKTVCVYVLPRHVWVCETQQCTWPLTHRGQYFSVQKFKQLELDAVFNLDFDT